MKIHAMEIDENGRSTSSFVEIKMNKVSETESLSAKQDGTIWRVGFRHHEEHARTSKDYAGRAASLEQSEHRAGHHLQPLYAWHGRRYRTISVQVKADTRQVMGLMHARRRWRPNRIRHRRPSCPWRR
jgi:hypothetical protein